MEDLIEKLQDVFRHDFPGSSFHPEFSTRRLGGSLLWEGFAEFDQVDRQEKLWKSIGKLNEEDQLKISLIITFTPDEYDIIKAESA